MSKSSKYGCYGCIIVMVLLFGACGTLCVSISRTGSSDIPASGSAVEGGPSTTSKALDSGVLK